MLSHLSTMFRLIGRSGPWNPATNEGNPIESEFISPHRAAYHAGMLKRGYQEGSAIPNSIGEHRSLARTALACCYLWQGGQRDKEVDTI